LIKRLQTGDGSKEVFAGEINNRTNSVAKRKYSKGDSQKPIQQEVKMFKFFEMISRYYQISCRQFFFYRN